MSKVRINDLARELEVKSKAILDALPQVGVTEKKTHSSSIEDHVADDGRSAEVWVNVEGDDTEADQSIEGLEAAKEYIRHELVERLRIRRAPELYFRLDRAEQDKARVEQLLERAKKRSKIRKDARGDQA